MLFLPSRVYYTEKLSYEKLPYVELYIRSEIERESNYELIETLTGVDYFQCIDYDEGDIRDCISKCVKAVETHFGCGIDNLIGFVVTDSVNTLYDKGLAVPYETVISEVQVTPKHMVLDNYSSNYYYVIDVRCPVLNPLYRSVENVEELQKKPSSKR